MKPMLLEIEYVDDWYADFKNADGNIFKQRILGFAMVEEFDTDSNTGMTVIKPIFMDDHGYVDYMNDPENIVKIYHKDDVDE